MLTPAIPANEAERLATLHSLNILDTPPEERFDLITVYAASLFNVPIALISLVDADRCWYKSSHGLVITEMPRLNGFCGHAILQNGITEISDARDDARFADNPLVSEAPQVRFYAGYPLTMKNGHCVGTLCLIDTMPKRLSEWEREHLATLAAMVEAELQGEDGGLLPGELVGLS